MSIKFKNPIIDAQDVRQSAQAESDPVFVASPAYAITQSDIDDWNSTIEDKNYLHTQSISSDSWVVVHNLNKYPSVCVIDSAGTRLEGAITYDSLNQVTISFAGDTSGTATLN